MPDDRPLVLNLPELLTPTPLNKCAPRRCRKCSLKRDQLHLALRAISAPARAPHAMRSPCERALRATNTLMPSSPYGKLGGLPEYQGRSPAHGGFRMFRSSRPDADLPMSKPGHVLGQHESASNKALHPARVVARGAPGRLGRAWRGAAGTTAGRGRAHAGGGPPPPSHVLGAGRHCRHRHPGLSARRLRALAVAARSRPMRRRWALRPPACAAAWATASATRT